MDEDRKQRWLEWRKLGKKGYILQHGGLNGIIILSIPTIIFPIIDSLLKGSFFSDVFNNIEFAKRLLFIMLIGFVGGCIYGWLSWHWNEAEYMDRK